MSINFNHSLYASFSYSIELQDDLNFHIFTPRLFERDSLTLFFELKIQQIIFPLKNIETIKEFWQIKSIFAEKNFTVKILKGEIWLRHK